MRQDEFYVICQSELICVEAEYNRIIQKVEVNCGKHKFVGKGKQGSNKGLFPFKFYDETHNLKFNLEIDEKKNFLLDVQGIPFENLPVRFYPIKISEADNDSDRHFTGWIYLNEVEFESEMTWQTELF